MPDISERLKKLPPYLFAEIDRKKKKLAQEGHDVINLGVGDPDLPTPQHIIDGLKTAAQNPENHRYPLGKGTTEFRKAIANYYERADNVALDPDDEICVLIGSKEGIAHFPLSALNPGDVSLVPEPGYPVYHIGTMLAGGESHFMPLTEELGFLPDLKNIPADVLGRAKVLYLNYPNNPTAAFATEEFILEAIALCKKHDIILVYDAAYHEMYYEKRPVSFLSLPGARDVGIEFNSLSKTYNMTGWRVGWACGNKTLVAALAKIKENVDSGTFDAIQAAGVTALNSSQNCVDELRSVYLRRRDVLAEGLKKIGWKIRVPQGTFYFWVKTPVADSMEMVETLLEKAYIVSTPGIGFGPSGEGYIRFSITNSEERIREAVKRMEEIWGEK